MIALVLADCIALVFFLDFLLELFDPLVPCPAAQGLELLEVTLRQGLS